MRNFRGFALLVDTLGMYPDANATRMLLAALGKYLNLTIDVSRLDLVADETKRTLESFGLIRNIVEEKKKEKSRCAGLSSFYFTNELIVNSLHTFSSRT